MDIAKNFAYLSFNKNTLADHYTLQMKLICYPYSNKVKKFLNFSHKFYFLK